MSVIASVVLGICLGGPAPADIQKAAQRVLVHPDYQRTMPGRTAYKEFRPQSGPSGRTTRPAARPIRDSGSTRPTTSRRTRRGNSSSGGSSDGGGGAADLGNALIWMLLIVGGVFLIVWITQLVRGRARDVEITRATQAAAAPAPLQLADTRTKAERLADEGRYAEAIHVLLLETMGQLAGRLASGLHKSWTSREVLRLTKLSADAHGPLEALVGAVETSLFGHETPGELDYRSCTRYFQEFAAAVGAEGAHGGTA